MAYPNSYKIKSAAAKLNRFDLSSNLVTTSDFGIFKPVYVQYLVPGDKFRINVNQFTRLMPMPCPTFGTIKNKLRAFFVPAHTICDGFNDFVSNNLKPQSFQGSLEPVYVPYTRASEIYKVFTKDNTLATAVATTVSKYDFKYGDGYNLTPKGRRIWDMLTSLGLKLPYVSATNHQDNIRINLLPILGLLKAYLDWIVPSRFCNNWYQTISFFKNELPTRSDPVLGKNVRGCLLEADIKKLLLPLYSFYEDDYFTSAFQSPYGYESAMASDINLPNQGNYNTADIQFGETYLQARDKGTDGFHAGPLAFSGPDQSVSSGANAINYFTLKSLGALQEMVNRGKLSGTKIQDYFKTTFGVTPSMDALDLSTYYGCQVNDIKIGDVTSTAGTETNALGDYAGKGFGYNNGTFEISANEHGYIYITNEIVCRSSYVQGNSYLFDMYDRLDFFQPELDNLGVSAIPKGRLVSQFFKGEYSNLPNYNRVFGFTPRYSEFKNSFDNVSGDFVLGSKNQGLDSWYLSRYFSHSQEVLWQQINEQFCTQSPDNGLQQLDYIFNSATNASDHFYQIFNFDVTAFRPMQSLSQYLETDETGKDGKVISVSSNGVNNS
ncbi:major capsid protein [Microvirus sp.]|nr:major capsid protein [Microvirus sp.]